MGRASNPSGTHAENPVSPLVGNVFLSVMTVLIASTSFTHTNRPCAAPHQISETTHASTCVADLYSAQVGAGEGVGGQVRSGRVPEGHTFMGIATPARSARDPSFFEGTQSKIGITCDENLPARR